MKSLRRFLANEDGMAMATAVGMIVVMTVLAVALIDQVTNESNRAANGVTSNAVYQAAEAGVNDYIAKLTDDSQYFDHCVAKGESTRQRNDSGVLVAHSTDTSSCQPGGASAWTAGVTWKYPNGTNGKDWWYGGTGSASGDSTLIRGYAYNLQITPPSSLLNTNYIDIVSTGCKVVDPSASPLVCDASVPRQAIEVYARRTTPADFQYILTDMPTTSGSVCWASTIYGRMYSTGNIYVCGATFYGNVLAEKRLVASGSYTIVSPGRLYDINHPDIRTVLKDSINFGDLLASVSKVQSNASLNTNLRAGSATTGYGTSFDDATASAWRFNFSSSGTVRVWKCVNSSSPESVQPYCNDVKLTSNVTLKSSTSTTINVDQSTGVIGSQLTGSFPTSCTGSCAIYVGPTTSGTIDKVTYTGRTDTSFTGVVCVSSSNCGSSGHAHLSGETVSLYPTGLPNKIGTSVPAYNGPVPPNGAIYTGQDAIVSWPSSILGYSETSGDGSPTSKVNGQATIASAQDIITAGDIHYASEPSSNGIGGANDDVLGLIAQGNITIAQYAPNNLWWRAATMAVDGTWGDYACRNGPPRGSSSYMTFVGTSTYGKNSGCIQYTGGYNIDHTYRITDDGTAPACPSTAPGCQNFTALKFLVPPWFPPLNGISTVLFRAVPPSYPAPLVPYP